MSSTGYYSTHSLPPPTNKKRAKSCDKCGKKKEQQEKQQSYNGGAANKCCSRCYTSGSCSLAAAAPATKEKCGDNCKMIQEQYTDRLSRYVVNFVQNTIFTSFVLGASSLGRLIYLSQQNRNILLYKAEGFLLSEA